LIGSAMKYIVEFQATRRLNQLPERFEGIVMQAGSLKALLQDFEGLVETIGGSPQANDIREFRRLFDAHEGTTVAQLAAKLAKGRGHIQSGPTSAPIRDLQNVFAKLQTLLSSANAKKAADDMEALINVLNGCDQASVREFVEQAQSWIINASKAKARSSKDIKKGLSSGDDVRAAVVSDYASALKQASDDNSAFDRLISNMQADKKVRAVEMREIAKTYLGYEIAKKKGRADVLKAIVERQALSARQNARGRSLDRLKSW
jgi:hypothetical protein